MYFPHGRLKNLSRTKKLPRLSQSRSREPKKPAYDKAEPGPLRVRAQFQGFSARAARDGLFGRAALPYVFHSAYAFDIIDAALFLFGDHKAVEFVRGRQLLGRDHALFLYQAGGDGVREYRAGEPGAASH